MAYVYQHIRLDTNTIFYIGIGSDLNYKRAYTKHKRNIYWNRIVDISDYAIEIIEDGIEWKDACKKEQFWINYYGRHNLGTGQLCNMTDGGEGTIGRYCSMETKLKMGRESKKKIYTKEYRKKLSMTSIGENNPMFGKHHSEDAKKKISDSQIGELHHWYGTKRSEKTKNKIGANQPLKISIIKCDLNGNEIETYPSMGLAAKNNYISEGNLSTYFKKSFITKQNRYRTLGGFIWKISNKT